MNYTEWNEGLKDAKRVMDLADEAANTFAESLVGRLRKVSPWTLRELKRELKDFNPQRRTWKK